MLPPDNPWPVVIVLMCVAVGLGLAWNRSRKSYGALAGALIALGVAVGCYAWSQSVETPAKVVTKQLLDMTVAFKNQEVEKTMSYFSKQGNLPSGMESMIKRVKVIGNLPITDISVTFKQQNSLATTHFRANAAFTFDDSATVDHLPTRWELDWQREANEWKVVEVRRLHLMNGTPVNLMSGK